MNRPGVVASRRGAACLALAVLCALVVLPAIARATTLERVTLAEITHRSEKAVIGTVVSTSAEAYPGGVRTAVRLDVTESLKGGVAGAITVYVPGGTLPGGLTEVVDGMPSFTPGEAACVFVDANGWVVGGVQGKVAIRGGLVSSTRQPVSALADAVKSAAGVSAKGAPEGFVDPLAADPQASPETAVTPVVTSVSPGTVGAGIGATITIAGSGFGSSPGSVTFFYQSGQPRIAATPIVSWSDGRIVCTVPVAMVNGYPGSPGSGPVVVTTAAGAPSSSSNANADLSISFGYELFRWPATNKAYPTTEVTYRVYTGGVAHAEALVDAGLAVWNAAGADFRYVDGGAYSSTQAPKYDGKNCLSWGADPPTAVIAQASTWYQGGDMIEADVEFNTYYSWGDGSANTMDIESIAMHETGHWLGLRDLYGADSAKVMYGFSSYGIVKRTLSAGDKAGILWIYGSAPAQDKDTTPPVTTSDTKPEYYLSATIHLTAKDAGSGVAATDYSVDGGATTPGTAVMVIGAGSHTLRYWSVDGAGNIETATTVPFEIVNQDAQPPDTESAIATSYVGAASISLVAHDELSGVAATHYRLDGGPDTIGIHVAESKAGTHTVEFWSVDVANNAEVHKTADFTVFTAPKAILSTPKTVSSVRKSHSFTVSGSLKPRAAAGSVVKLYFYRFTTGHWKLSKTVNAKVSDSSAYSKYSVKVKLTARGSWRVRAYFADTAHRAGYSAYRRLKVK